MPDRAMVTFPAAIFKRDHFFIFALLEYLRGRFGAAAMRDFLTIDMHQYFKSRALAGLGIKKIDIDRIAFRDTILSSTGFNNCVGHNSKLELPLSLMAGEKAAQNPTAGLAWQAERLSGRDQENDLALWGMGPVVGKQISRAAAPKFFELLG